jgi:hypothetical protein
MSAYVGYIGTTQQLFLQKIKISRSGCWLWTGAKNHSGRGHARVNKKLITAPRLAWKLFKGDFSRHLYICHKCDNPTCVNPKHLFLGTQLDNVQDSIKKGRFGAGKHERSRTCCPKGHKYSTKNTYIEHTINNKYKRHCRICRRIQGFNWRKTNKKGLR